MPPTRATTTTKGTRASTTERSPNARAARSPARPITTCPTPDVRSSVARRAMGRNGWDTRTVAAPLGIPVDVPLLGDDAAGLADFARAAERAGIARLWAPELYRSATVPLAVAAAATERIELGTGIALAFTRSPMVMALEALDLDELSGGRLVAGSRGRGAAAEPGLARRAVRPARAPHARDGGGGARADHGARRGPGRARGGRSLRRGRARAAPAPPGAPHHHPRVARRRASGHDTAGGGGGRRLPRSPGHVAGMALGPAAPRAAGRGGARRAAGARGRRAR